MLHWYRLVPPHDREDQTAAIALEHKGAEVFWMGQGREGWVGWERRVDMRGGRVWEERMLSIVVND